MNILNCLYCKKEFSYKKKGEYEKHVILCELIASSSSKKGDEEEEEEEILSHRELYKIVKELSIQNKKLSEKVSLLEKIVQRGTSIKKVDILERLKSYKPLETYNDWIRNIEINEEDIESLITETIPQVISDILSRNLSDSKEIFPIISSDLKKSMIYIYDVNYSSSSASPSSSPEQGGYISSSLPEWIKMESEHYIKLICTLYKSLLTTFKTKWIETNKGRYMVGDIESKLINKITSIDIVNANNTTNRKIWQSLYSLVSKDI